MEFHEVKLIINHIPDFFVDHQIEKFIADIPFQKLETHISEINKLAIIKLKNDSHTFSLIISSQNIQLHMKTLEQMKDYLMIFEQIDENVKDNIRVDFISFNGIVETPNSTETYNHFFKQNLSEKIKVKMLGIDIQSTNFEYRLSLNKHIDVMKVNAKVLMQCSLGEVSQKANLAYAELNEELQQLKELF